MLEEYFVKPEMVDRVRSSWIGPEIERYVMWLAARGYRAGSVRRRVPQLLAFGEFARASGARAVEDLPAQVKPFVAAQLKEYRGTRQAREHEVAREVRAPIEQMLCVVVVGFTGGGRRRREFPFLGVLPGLVPYLADERGLRPATIVEYRHYLAGFEAYLADVGVTLGDVSPALLSAFVVERAGAGLSKGSVGITCAALRVLLRYAHREGVLPCDLSQAVERPQTYRLADIPRSISWAEVDQVLGCVDRCTPCGKRDWAILMLLVTYGLRSREIAALTLDDIDWRRDRLAVPRRKAGHSTAFPLSAAVGEALVEYLRHGRPQTEERRVFFRALAPVVPMSAAAVAGRASHYLLKAGIDVPRPGSHTLRHTCVQRLVDADFALKTIGDFIGHGSAKSTEIYAKVAVEQLREVALGDGEEVLS
jgi:site-specific recombinase XerD